MAQQVNGIDMAGKTQSDAVLLLRDTPLGGTVSMVVSRIVLEEDEQTPYPRELVRLTWHANTTSHQAPVEIHRFVHFSSYALLHLPPELQRCAKQPLLVFDCET